MSNVGKPLRQLYYDLNGFEGDKPSGKTLVKFAYGDLCEALVIALAQAAGFKAERFQEEVIVEDVPGHIDLILEGVLVDVKSCSPYSFQKFKDGSIIHNDPFGYVGQLSGYKNAINLPAAWIAINKIDGEICVLELPDEISQRFNVQAKIKLIKETIAGPNEPERCYQDEPEGKSGNRKISVSCSYCSHKIRCWRDSNNGQGLRVFQYSTGPKWLSVVEREPKVEEAFKANPNIKE